MSHVNVAMRVRPVEGSGDYVTVVPPGTMLLNKPDGDMYQFTYTFAAQNATNEEIYNEVGKPVVESVLDGYNGTVLAYGQTGSGKTFTMLGPPGKLSKMTAEQKGIMPRALEQLFKALKANRNITSWKMAVTYIEVYCEVIRDLLSVDKTAREDKRRAGIEVTEAKGVMHLKTVTPTEVKTMQDVATLIEKAQEVRAQAATNMNDRSSRSHTILTIWLETTSADGSFHSKLNLVDLAGSERRKAIGEQGAQTNHEGDAINKSLLTLQNVVMALGQKGAVPSYRTSKLTHFLKDSIGGNCKTTLCACIWGDPGKVNETLATCRFAEKMMKVVVDAKKNQGGLNTVYGNKVKLDPTVLALMEKRVADGIAAARAELMAQYGMAPNGALMSDAERQELEELRGRVQELAIASAPGPNKMPSSVAEEMEKLRLQLQEAETKAKNLEEQQRIAAEEGLRRNADAGDPSSPTATLRRGLDESVEAFIKLKELQPQQQVLQAALDRDGKLSNDDQEALDFISDEIGRLMEILHNHGFNFPESSKPADDGVLLDKTVVEATLYQDTTCLDSSRGTGTSDISPTATDKPTATSPAKPPRAPGTAGQLGSNPSLYPGAAIALDGRASFNIPDSRASMQHIMSLPNDLVKPQKTGISNLFKSGQKKGNALSDDMLMAHNQLQGGKGTAQNDMVFISPLDHDNVKAVLNDHSHVDPSLPLDLAKMPKMPKLPPH